MVGKYLSDRGIKAEIYEKNDDNAAELMVQIVKQLGNKRLNIGYVGSDILPPSHY